MKVTHQLSDAKKSAPLTRARYHGTSHTGSLRFLFQSSRPLTRARYADNRWIDEPDKKFQSSRPLTRARYGREERKRRREEVSILAPSHEGALPAVCWFYQSTHWRFNPRALSRGRATYVIRVPGVDRWVSILAPSHEGALRQHAKKFHRNHTVSILAPSHEGALRPASLCDLDAYLFQSSRPLTRARYSPLSIIAQTIFLFQSSRPLTRARYCVWTFCPHCIGSFNPRALSRGRATTKTLQYALRICSFNPRALSRGRATRASS